jgi:TonB family protein
MSASPPRRARAAALILLAAGLQVPLFAAFTATTQGAGVTPPRAPAPPSRILATLTPPPPPEPDRALVEPSDGPELPEPPKTPADKVSDKTTRTDRETAPPPSPRPPRPRSATEPTPQPPRPPEEPPARAPQPTPGERAPTVLDRRKGDGLLEAPTSEAAALRNLARLAEEAGPSPSSRVADVAEGSETVLNADRHRFADFFLRVKREVELEWTPAAVYRRHDPTGERFGVKDRYTLLGVTLDPAGNLVKLVTSRASGMDFLDEEARRAMRSAAPFPNPPRGLVDADGLIRFEFGFWFEISRGGGSTRWRRL